MQESIGNIFVNQNDDPEIGDLQSKIVIPFGEAMGVEPTDQQMSVLNSSETFSVTNVGGGKDLDDPEKD